MRLLPPLVAALSLSLPSSLPAQSTCWIMPDTSATMDSARVDALIYPTWSNPPRLIGDLNTPHGNNSPFFSPSTGFPAITVPMGYSRDSLPAGMTLYGRPWSEATLIRLAYAYEQSTRHRRPPRSTPPLR